jgi:hypothetical protein
MDYTSSSRVTTQTPVPNLRIYNCRYLATLIHATPTFVVGKYYLRPSLKSQLMFRCAVNLRLIDGVTFDLGFAPLMSVSRSRVENIQIQHVHLEFCSFSSGVFLD